MKQSWFYIAPLLGAIFGIVGISCLFIDGNEDYNTTGKYVIATFGIASFFLITTIDYIFSYRSFLTDFFQKLNADTPSRYARKMV